MLFEHTIHGPARSGKTTLALGALERLHSEGHLVAFVVPCAACVDVAEFQHAGWRAVAVDDVERCPPDVLYVLRRALSSRVGPTQLLLVSTSD